MTTIMQFIPDWLRNRLQRRALRQTANITKKDRQVLPALPKQARPSVAPQDDDGSAGYRLLWRL